jgi:hypothetical protein
MRPVGPIGQVGLGDVVGGDAGVASAVLDRPPDDVLQHDGVIQAKGP